MQGNSTYKEIAQELSDRLGYTVNPHYGLKRSNCVRYQPFVMNLGYPCFLPALCVRDPLIFKPLETVFTPLRVN